jgi:hypothetical protein
MANALVIVNTECAMPAIFAAASPKARKRMLEFFGASIRNENTRKAYMAACAAFFDFLADNGVTALEYVGPLHGAAGCACSLADREWAALGTRRRRRRGRCPQRAQCSPRRRVGGIGRLRLAKCCSRLAPGLELASRQRWASPNPRRGSITRAMRAYWASAHMASNSSQSKFP